MGSTGLDRGLRVDRQLRPSTLHSRWLFGRRPVRHHPGARRHHPRTQRPGRRSRVLPLRAGKRCGRRSRSVGRRPAGRRLAVLVVPPQHALSVAIVGEGRRLLPRILDGFGLGHAEVDVRGVARLDPARTGSWGSWCSTMTATHSMPGVPTLTISEDWELVLEPCSPTRVAGSQLGGPDVAIVRRSHDTGSFIASSGRKLQPDESVEVLLTRNPQSFDHGMGGRRVTPCSHRLRSGRLEARPYEPGFVAFLYNTVDWLGHSNATNDGRPDPISARCFDSPFPAGLEGDVETPGWFHEVACGRFRGMAGWGPLASLSSCMCSSSKVLSSHSGTGRFVFPRKMNRPSIRWTPSSSDRRRFWPRRVVPWSCPAPVAMGHWCRLDHADVRMMDLEQQSRWTAALRLWLPFAFELSLDTTSWPSIPASEEADQWPRPGERIAQYENMAEADPDNEMAHFSLGSAYLQAGRAAEAAVSLERCIELNEDMKQNGSSVARP